MNAQYNIEFCTCSKRVINVTHFLVPVIEASCFSDADKDEFPKSDTVVEL